MRAQGEGQSERTNMHREQTEVLVVGAGPVGLLTAVMLTEAGIETRIIDSESRTTTRSYACALHPQTLELLDALGVLPGILQAGKKVQTVAFYDGPERKAELDLKALDSRYPFLLILPQGDFEKALEKRLRDKGGVTVDWNHRFEDVQPEQEGVRASVEQLGGTSTGYIVPHWETVVQKRFEIQARFVVGADGYNSVVRHRMGAEMKKVSGPEFFAAYEFESDAPSGDEARVVLDDRTTNVLWPMQGNKLRWTFQLIQEEQKERPAEFPEKERSAIQVVSQTVDEEIRQYVQRVAAHRAPWSKVSVSKVTWCTDVMFEQRVATSFGSGACWLAGDAAHQTGPVGAQSMNVGMLEAQALAGYLKKELRQPGGRSGLEHYNSERQAEWSALLGLNGGLKPKDKTSDWVRRRLPRILSCIPSSGQALKVLAGQLQVDFTG